ncbi:MAG: hypothetical protein WAO83_26610 [Fuerstiella sp.]
MKQIQIVIFSVVILSCVLDSGIAQPPQQQPQSSPSTDSSQQGRSPQVGAATGSTIGNQRSMQSESSQQAGRQSSRTQQQSNGRSGNQGQGFVGNRGGGNGSGSQGSNRTGSGNQRPGNQDPRREFSQNALRFDSNEDGYLAANELTNLFLTLASTMQQDHADFYNNLNNRRPQAITGTIIDNRRGTTTTTTTTTRSNQVVGSNSGSGSLFNSVSARLAQRRDMRQAVFVFLQLAMQFDANGDGLLSQSELLQLDSALVANDLSLVAAASSVSGQAAGIQSAQQQSSSVTTTTRQTTRMRANDPNRFGRQNGVGGSNSGFGFGLQSVNQQQPNIALGTRTYSRGNRGPVGGGSSQPGNSSSGRSNSPGQPR